MPGELEVCCQLLQTGEQGGCTLDVAVPGEVSL